MDNSSRSSSENRDHRPHSNKKRHRIPSRVAKRRERPPVSKWIHTGILLLFLRLVEFIVNSLHHQNLSSHALWGFEENLGWLLVVFGIIRTLILRNQARVKKDATDAAGLKGEEETASELSKLGAGYQTFNRLYLFNRNHRQEFDHVVVGPTGVFHVETKNWSGEIEFHGSRLERSTRGSFDNPMEQMARHDTHLKNLLHDSGVDAPVVGLLCFTNPHARVTTSTKQPFRCVSLGQLNDVITSYGKRSARPRSDDHRVAGSRSGAPQSEASHSHPRLTSAQVQRIVDIIAEHSKRHVGTGV